VYVGGIRFLKPISVGDLVELKAELMHTGRTSMHISVSVHARNPRDPQRRFTTHCILVFVALDDQGKPQRIPDFVPDSDHSKRLNAYAKRMIELREQMQSEAQAFLTEMDV